MIEQQAQANGPELEGRRPDAAWEQRIGDLATEDLLAIRHEIQVLIDHVGADREPGHARSDVLLAAAEGLLQRFRQ